MPAPAPLTWRRPATSAASGAKCAFMPPALATRVPGYYCAAMTGMRALAAKLQQLVDRIDPHAGRYRMLFEASPLPMCVLDDETLRFLAVNDAALRVYGYGRGEFLGMCLGDLRRSGEPGLRARVAEGVETVQHTLERVRQLSLSLRPPQLDDLGLAAALRSHLDRQASVAGIAAHFDATEAPHELDPDTETACFRVAQEAINNVLRHAHAHNLWVRLFTASGRLALSVRDDGRGFDLEAVRRRAASGASLGLVGMEERIALAGGSFELRATPGAGTVLLATFPVRRRASEAA